MLAVAIMLGNTVFFMKIGFSRFGIPDKNRSFLDRALLTPYDRHPNFM